MYMMDQWRTQGGVRLDYSSIDIALCDHSLLQTYLEFIFYFLLKSFFIWIFPIEFTKGHKRFLLTV